MSDLQLRATKFKHELTQLQNTWGSSKKNNSEENPKSQNTPWFRDNSLIVTRYLQQVHFINTPEIFPTLFKQELRKNYSSDKGAGVPLRTLDAIVRSCEKWIPYLADKEAFERLVCLEVLSMARIHASVISTRNIEEKHVANGVRLSEDARLPEKLTTVVTYYGRLEVYT